MYVYIYIYICRGASGRQLIFIYIYMEGIWGLTFMLLYIYCRMYVGEDPKSALDGVCLTVCANTCIK